MKFDGEILQVLTPKQPRNAKLAYLQYGASLSDLALAISVELIRKKTLAQLATLEKYPHLSGQKEAITFLEEGLQVVSQEEEAAYDMQFDNSGDM